MEARSPDPLSGVELESDMFSHDLFFEPEFNVQHIGVDLQPEQLRPDDVQLWPSEVTSTSEEPGNACTTQEGSMTDLGTGVIEEQICFGMVGSAFCQTSRRMRSTKTGADPGIAGPRKGQIGRQGRALTS